MAPRKLSDSDKSEIVDLYKEPGQTTSTLAEQYGVSNSTISRILKNSIPSDEYSELISQKRMAGSSDKSAGKSAAPARRKKTRTKAAKAQPKAETETVPELEPSANQPTPDDEAPAAKPAKSAPGPKLKSAAEETDASDEKPAEKTGTRRRKRRSRVTEVSDEQLPLLQDETEESAAASSDDDSAEQAPAESLPTGRPKPILAGQKADEDEDDDDDEDDLLGLDETLSDDFGDDDLDEEEDDDDDEDDDGVDMPILKTSSEDALEIMPLGEAVLPKPCYLVVDMRAELITRPLVEFSDLGKIPSSEEREKTLPVFDNHRVARRFSRNKQRVIKVPDGSLITRTSPYLTAKGITRLLVDGRVFDLVGME
ncbi:MAG: helix-turn-helix domain-containing protein [Cyanobacteria bacterium P01_D01_bin.36]